MIRQATKRIFTIVIILLFIPYAGTAGDNPELSSAKSNSSFSTQGEQIYIYSFFDEGLMDSKEIYELDKLIYDIASNPKKLSISDFDAIDYELFAKGQERLNNY